MTDTVANNDPWAGWAIDPADAVDFQVDEMCTVRASHENGVWWLLLLITITRKIETEDGPDWGFKVLMVLDGTPEMMGVFDKDRP